MCLCDIIVKSVFISVKKGMREFTRQVGSKHNIYIAKKTRRKQQQYNLLLANEKGGGLSTKYTLSTLPSFDIEYGEFLKRFLFLKMVLT